MAGHTHTPFNLATRLPALVTLRNRIDILADRYTDPGQRTRIQQRSDAVQRRISLLENRIASAPPHDVEDVAAQLMLLIHKSEKNAEAPNPELCVEISRQLHQAVRFLADEAGFDPRDIGGEEYMIPQGAV
jgi:hypothetical protein